MYYIIDTYHDEIVAGPFKTLPEAEDAYNNWPNIHAKDGGYIKVVRVVHS